MQDTKNSVTSALLFKRCLAMEIYAAAIKLPGFIEPLRLGEARLVRAAADQIEIHTDMMAVTLTQSNRRMPSARLHGNERRDAGLARGLRHHSAYIQIVVADQPDARARPSMADKADLCRSLTRCLANLTAPTLVLSPDGATLWSAERRAARMYGTLAPARLARTAAKLLPHRRSPEPTADGAPVYEMTLSGDQIRSGTSVGLFALLTALSGPLAITAVVYRLFQGGEPRRLAQLVMLAGLFAALDLAQIWNLGALVTRIAS